MGFFNSAVAAFEAALWSLPGAKQQKAVDDARRQVAAYGVVEVDRVIDAAADLAAVFGTDLREASICLSMAIQHGDIKQLRRYGIAVDPGVDLLEYIEGRFGGANAACRPFPYPTRAQQHT